MQKHLLRICISILLLHSSILNLKAQWVTIPDTAFVSYLQATFPACMNGNLMDTTCSGVVNVTQFGCGNRPIKDLTGIEYFDNLQLLDCSYDSINVIPALPNLLATLVLYSNQLTSLPALPNSLTFLDCQWNQLVSLPALPNSLINLYCTLNQLSSLPALPNSLQNLNCEHNQITSLPALPNSLTTLHCQYNQLNSLPALPSSLTSLDCEFNQLSNLPTLPNSLTDLECGFNQLSSLPVLPNSLTSLNCPVNQLNSLPELPDSLAQFYCDNNPLFCLPRLKKIVNFSFNYTSITCLPNFPQSNSYSSPLLSSVPLCDMFNSNGCSVYWNITGKIYNDTSGNCVKDIGETNVQNMKVNLYENGVLTQQNYSGGYGIYSFDTDMGTFETTIDTTGVPFDILCPASRFDTSVITALDSFDYNMDFAMQCKPGFDVGAWSLVSSNRFQPAHTAYIEIHAGDWAQFWGQNCNTNNLSGQLVTTISGAATFVSAAAGALTPVVSGNTLTYNISNWSAVNPNTDFNIVVQTDTTAPLGSQICFDVNVTPTAGDNNVSNNHLSHCFTVVSSYDPNEKEVSPVSSVDASDWLTYTIHFQNTGTATAEHIYVTDTLDANIDASTFQLLAYSHQPMVQLKENAVRFNFPNINLPDSNANEPLSHGYVQYKVKLKNNLPVGTHISNTAFIYFDFNAPVVTNTTSNTITTATSIKALSEEPLAFSIYPNPASTQLFIQTNGTAIEQVNIYNTTGSLVMAAASLVNNQLSIVNLANGVYIAEIKTKDGSVRKRWVKM